MQQRRLFRVVCKLRRPSSSAKQTISDEVVKASGAERRGSEARSAIKLVGFVDAVRARNAAEDAKELARLSGLPGLSYGQGDAMRHCTWSCQMTRKMGAESAKLIGDNHEIWGAGPHGGRQMDLNSNAIGRDLSARSGVLFFSLFGGCRK